MKTLRYYQRECKAAIQFGLAEYDRVLAVMGTGGGKTVMAAHLIGDLLPGQCIYIADQTELCDQPMEMINAELGIIPALEKAQYHSGVRAQVIVASAQTLADPKRLAAFPPGLIKYAIVDEAHRGSDRDQKILHHLQCKAVGITATGFRAKVRDLTKYYEHTAYKMGMVDLIEEGFAPPWDIEVAPVEIDLEEVKVKRGFDGKDFDQESLSTTIAPYYERIIEMLLERGFEEKSVMVRLPLIKSSQAFTSIALSHGVNVAHVDGKSEDRRHLIDAFRNGHIKWICNADLLSTGVDIPRAEVFVNLSPTASAVKYQQGIGRIMRVLPGIIDDLPEKDQSAERRARIATSPKPRVRIMDFLWQHQKLGIQNAANLVASSEEEAKAIYEAIKKKKSPEDLLAIQQAVLAEREAKLAKQLEQVATAKLEGGIDPYAFGFLLGSKELMAYEPEYHWETQPPSPQQLARLEQWKIDTSKVTSKGHASRLMGNLIFRFKHGLATINQMRRLTSLKVSFDPHRLTIKEASNLIAARSFSRVKHALRSGRSDDFLAPVK